MCELFTCFFLSFWHPVDFPDHGRLFTFLAMADALRLLGSPGPWEREALSYYHHSLILDTVQPPYDNDVFIAGKRARKNDHVIPFQPLLYLVANIIHTFVFHVPGSLIQLRLHQKSKSRKISNRFHTAFTLTILPLCGLMTSTIDFRADQYFPNTPIFPSYRPQSISANVTQ